VLDRRPPRTPDRSRRRTRAGTVLAGAALALGATAGPASADAFVAGASWEVASPDALAVAGDGTVFVAVSPAGGGDGVARYGATGVLQKRWGGSGEQPGQLSHPLGIAVGPDRTVYVSDLSRRVSVFTPDGAVLGASPLGGPTGDPLIASDVDVDARGELYATHNGVGYDELPGGVLRFAADRRPLASWGAKGGGDGQFTNPSSVASDGRGAVYVADPDADRIQRFTDGGAFVRSWGQVGSGPTELRDPEAVAVDAAGDVLVADRGNSRIQRYSPDGALRESIPVPRRDGSPSRPWDLDVDAAGNLYVLDRANAAWGSVVVLRRVTGPVVSSTTLRLRGGRIAVRVRCAGPSTCRGTLRLRGSRGTVGSASYRVAEDRTSTVRVRPTARGREILRASATQRLTVRLQPAKGKAVTGTATFRR
jgi:sugar lactone lactonase YvrE